MRFLVGRLPFDPSFVGLGAILLVAVRPQKLFRCEHHCRCEEKERFVSDRAAGSPRLRLGVLEHIDILGDALNFEVIALHLIMQCHKVEAVTTCASCLEVSN